MNNRALWLLLVGVVVVGCLVGCRPRKVTISGGGSDVPESQYTNGLVLYGRHCAQCHEDSGEGGEDAPALVGDKAFPLQSTWEDSERKVELRTALDIYNYSRESMPPLEPGSLKEYKYMTILAYILKEGGHDVPEELSTDNAGDLKVR